MSAYVQSHAHINALVQWAAQRRPGARLDPLKVYIGDGDAYDATAWLDLRDSEGKQRAVEILFGKNLEAVASRYPDCDTKQLPGTISEVRAGAIVYWEDSRYRLDSRTPVEILKACDGYEYQACESPTWIGSPAWKIIDAIRGRAISCLPGYDAADTWSIDAPDDTDIPKEEL